MIVVVESVVVSEDPEIDHVAFAWTSVPLGFPVQSSVSIRTMKLSVGVPTLSRASCKVFDDTHDPMRLTDLFVFPATFPRGILSYLFSVPGVATFTASVTTRKGFGRNSSITISHEAKDSPAIEETHCIKSHSIEEYGAVTSFHVEGSIAESTCDEENTHTGLVFFTTSFHVVGSIYFVFPTGNHSARIGLNDAIFLSSVIVPLTIHARGI